MQIATRKIRIWSLRQTDLPEMADLRNSILTHVYPYLRGQVYLYLIVDTNFVYPREKVQYDQGSRFCGIKTFDER